MRGWYFGKFLCDAWLTLDYVASNTSVMNLLIICIDRYLSVSYPVKYRNKRKGKKIFKKDSRAPDADT